MTNPVPTGRREIPTVPWALRRIAQVLAAGTYERLRTVPAWSPKQVPPSPKDVGPQWLTAVLCQNTPGATVLSVAHGGASVGTTTRSALTATYNDRGVAAGLPTRLFVKCTTSLAQRIMLGLGGLIHGEPGFYMHIRPLFQIEAPVGYFAAVAGRSWRSIVLMEDVASTRGASFWRPSTKVTREEIEDLLGNMATWHGALWGSPRLAEWRWLKTPADQMGVIDALIGLADRTRAGARRAQAVIPSPVWRRQRELYLALRRSMVLASQGPPTYLHGDLHIANTYRTDDGAIGICDWQVGLKGSWAHDFAYILATALGVEDRRAWERELVDLYVERLAATGGPAMPPATAWEAYRRATFYPYFAWLYTIGRSRLQPTFQPDQTSLTMIERISAAIDDLDSFGAVGL